MNDLLGYGTPLGELPDDFLLYLKLFRQLLYLFLELCVDSEDLLCVFGLVLKFFEQLLVLEYGKSGVRGHLIPPHEE
jgi:hypothetical protein